LQTVAAYDEPGKHVTGCGTQDSANLVFTPSGADGHNTARVHHDSLYGGLEQDRVLQPLCQLLNQRTDASIRIDVPHRWTFRHLMAVAVGDRSARHSAGQLEIDAVEYAMTELFTADRWCK
jgi:hypothetical protein